jgi:hypothetical protein
MPIVEPGVRPFLSVSICARSTGRGTSLEVSLRAAGRWTERAASGGITVVVGKMPAIRKRYRILLFAAVVVALAVPVGYALSLEAVPSLGRSVQPVARPIASAPVVPQARNINAASPSGRTSSRWVPQGFDAAGLLIVGTVLFGLAAVVRRAI